MNRKLTVLKIEVKDLYCVYAHVNKMNKKMYVGITKNIKKRWAGNGNAYKQCTLFYNAICKYGWNNFDHLVLFSCLRKETACNIEKELIKIKKLNCKTFGYNILPGGETSPCFKGAKHPMFNKKHTKEAKEKMSKNHWDCSGKNNPFYGNHCFLGGNHVLAKRVMCVETGVIYESIADAERETGNSHSNICKALKGKIKTCGNCHWKYI